MDDLDRVTRRRGQCFRRCEAAFGIRHSAFGIRHSAFGISMLMLTGAATLVNVVCRLTQKSRADHPIAWPDDNQRAPNEVTVTFQVHSEPADS
jgi:hypothetical protein